MEEGDAVTGRVLSDQEWRLQEAILRYKSHAGQAARNVALSSTMEIMDSNACIHGRWLMRAEEAESALAALRE